MAGELWWQKNGGRAVAAKNGGRAVTGDTGGKMFTRRWRERDITPKIFAKEEPY